jgi:hypothetical protein
MSDLLLRADALPELLDNWHGRVWASDVGPARNCVLQGIDHDRVYLGLRAHPYSTISLDLSLPECRDRVARVLARVVGLAPVGSTAPVFAEWGRIYRLYVPVAHYLPWGKDTSKPHPGERYFYPAMTEALDTPHRVDIVPSLSTLDPSDPALLPDGSRVVDARALLLVAEHIGAQK